MNSIHDICEQYNITNYTINDDGSIDVNGNVWLCRYNLTELPLTFNRVSGYFICSHNKLTRLKGCPRWIGGNFDCSYNRLSSLEFSPDYINGYFSCEQNHLINNLCESEIGGIFYTTLDQDGLILDSCISTNYNEWRKLYKRKQILENIFSII